MKRLRNGSPRFAVVAAVSIANLVAFCAPGRESNESASSGRCAFGPGQDLGPLVNSPVFDGSPTVSADETELFFTSAREGQQDLFSSTRTSKESERAEFSPSLSTDGNTLYFASERSGSIEVWVSTRKNPSQDWGAPTRLGADVNVPGGMTLAPFISHDQRSLYFMSARPGAAGAACTPMTCFDRVDLYVATLNCR